MLPWFRLKRGNGNDNPATKVYELSSSNWRTPKPRSTSGILSAFEIFNKISALFSYSSADLTLKLFFEMHSSSVLYSGMLNSLSRSPFTLPREMFGSPHKITRFFFAISKFPSTFITSSSAWDSSIWALKISCLTRSKSFTFVLAFIWSYSCFAVSRVPFAYSKICWVNRIW